MSLNVSELAEQLQEMVTLQRLPVVFTYEDYENYIKKGIKKLFVDTNRASAYDQGLFIEDNEGNSVFNYDIPLDEQAYILVCAQIAFYRFVQNDKNDIVGYSTDALSVTNADKPYANLKDTLLNLENERRVIFYKMVRYSLGS